MVLLVCEGGDVGDGRRLRVLMFSDWMVEEMKCWRVGASLLFGHIPATLVVSSLLVYIVYRLRNRLDWSHRNT